MQPDAFELALAALARKERTVGEMRQWLAARGTEPAEIDGALERLIAIGELDDARFAQRYAEDKRSLRGWGPERIRAALVERGVDPSLAAAAAGEEAPAAQAERAAALMIGRGSDLGDDAGRGKALAYLARRGYDYETAYQAIRLAQRRAA